MTREEAISAIKARCSFCEFFPICVNDKPECFSAAEMAIEALKAQQWIPCSEQLPEEGKEVLVTVWNRCEVASYNSALDGLQEWRFDGFSLDNKDFADVKAWMPLPEAYKGDSNTFKALDALKAEGYADQSGLASAT